MDLISARSVDDPEEEEDSFRKIHAKIPSHYKSPELISYNKGYSGKCDVWSCGAILYTMITGVPPFFEQGPQLLEQQISSGIMSTEFPNFEKNK